MRFGYIAAAVLVWSVTTSGQWIKQQVNTTAGLRGLSVVSEKVVWASGTGGTFLKTLDGGKTWKVGAIPGVEKLDFRDIEAFDANMAYVLSIGNGESSRIYETTDGGKSWREVFRNMLLKAFFDALACWDKNNCIAISDPVEGRFILTSTSNGGETWKMSAIGGPASAKDGEAAFAASGTCLITQGKSNAFIVSGGTNARVFRAIDRGVIWTAADTSIVSGTAGSGIFSIAMFDSKNGVIVGGNYEKPDEHSNNLAFTSDGGTTWVAGSGLNGYRSGVTYIDKKTIVAVGSNGSDISRDGGKTWKSLDKENYNAVRAKGKKAVWAVGAKGLVAKMK